jgi:CubicO group peptidase (beta-lactamase class C family)
MQSRLFVAPLALALFLTPGARAQDNFARVEALSAHVESVLKQYNIPGASIAVFRDFEIEWARGYGFANVDTKKPVDTLTLFQAASISKPVVALGVMRLVREGRLDLDRNVNDYLTSWKLPENEFTAAKPLTLRAILSHTGGLNVGGFKGYEAGAPAPTVPQLLDGKPPANSEAVRVTKPVGAKFEYSGGGTTIMQQLLIDVLKMPFPEIVRRYSLEPAGMRFSTYEQPLPPRLAPFASAGHEKGKVIVGERHVYPEMAAAGLSTTASDLARFAIAIQKARLGQNPGLLSSELANAMTTPVLPDSFGLGFELFRKDDAEKRFFGHTGGNVGYRCWLLATRTGGNGVVIMTNGDEFKAVSEIALRIVAEYGW